MRKIGIIDYDMSVRGGVEQVTASLSAALADHYEVHVISLCHSRSEGLQYDLDSRVRYCCLLEKPDRLRSMVKALRPRLRAYVQSQGIDVVLIQETYAGLLASVALAGSGVKRIFADHGALMNQWDRKDMVFIRFLSAALCHRVVTLTEQNREAYIRKFATPKRKISCIYNWIDLSVPRSEAYRADAKKILSAGRFGKEKGFDLLVEAYEQVAKLYPDWQLDIYGDGEMMPAVKAMVEEKGLTGKVNLPGMCHRLAECYREYAFYVLPSQREGMPLVLLEAKANRLPIVSFDIMTGPREIVTHGVDGILVPKRESGTLAQAMCRMIEDGAMRRQMSERSQDNLEKFDKGQILRRWRDLIDSL